MAKGRNKLYSKANNSYSTEEILTGGTWDDGKPIYSKTFLKVITEISDTIPFEITSEEIKFIETTFFDFNNDGKGSFSSNTSTIYDPISPTQLTYYNIRAYYFQDDSSFRIDNSVTTHNLIDDSFVQLPYNSASGFLLNISIKYTKTTD